MKKGKPDIIGYKDFRQYLRDWYEYKKEANKNFSYRLFSRKAGFKSPNFLKLVMDGQRNISAEGIDKFVAGLELNKQESSFFRELVLFTQAGDNLERDLHYRKMLRSKKLRKLKPLEKDKYEYFSQWYNPVIKELVSFSGFDGTPEWIAKRVHPAIAVDEARKSLELLKRLGFIDKDEEGRWVCKEGIVTSGDDVPSHTIFTYHLNMLDVSKKALQEVRHESRDVSALTIGIPKSKLKTLRSMIRDFRKNVLEFLSDDEKSEEVVQLNIQMYPVVGGEE